VLGAMMIDKGVDDVIDILPDAFYKDTQTYFEAIVQLLPRRNPLTY
jgi:hypothetical protein